MMSINARAGRGGQMRHDIEGMHLRGMRAPFKRVSRGLAQHDAHQVGRVTRAELLHDARAMHLDGAR